MQRNALSLSTKISQQNGVTGRERKKMGVREEEEKERERENGSGEKEERERE